VFENCLNSIAKQKNSKGVILTKGGYIGFAKGGQVCVPSAFGILSSTLSIKEYHYFVEIK